MGSTGKDRFIKATVNDGCTSISKVSVHPVVGSWEEDFDQVVPLLLDKTPCFILYRTDKKSENNLYLWYVLGFVPDDARSKTKMLYPATRNNLTSQLGQTNIIEYIHGTVKDEFSAKGFQQYIVHKTSDVPLSEQEKLRKEERELEVTTVVELNTVVQQSTGPGQSNVTFPIDDAVTEAVTCFKSGQFNYLRIGIETKKEHILLDEASFVTIEELKDKVPNNDCAYHFFNWAHNHEGKDLNSVVFAFSTPDGTHGKPAPIRSRTLYASSRSHILNALGLEIACRLEIGTGDEFTESEFGPKIHPPVVEEKAAFKKPVGPKGRKAGAK